MATASAEAPNRSRRSEVPDRRDTLAPKAPVHLGPLLAVCGLTGGAGTTTLAYLIAQAATRVWSEQPVLVADGGGPSGGLAACSGVEVPRSLGELAGELSAGARLGGGLYAIGHDGLHVLASGPEFSTSCPGEHLSRLLDDAREAHGLTVVDCGTLSRAAEQTAAAAATHTAWVLPATADGIKRGRRVLDAAPRLGSKEIVIARRDAHRAGVSLREVRRIAADRPAPLVLVPDLPALDGGRFGLAAEAAQVPIQAILGALRR